MRGAFKKAGKFSKLTGRERLLFFEALALHLWVGLLLKIIPFRRIPRLFASPQSSAGSPQSAVLGRQSEVIELVKAAIQRAGRVSPWRNKCLVSSLAGRCMLCRRNIDSRLSLGMAKRGDGKLTAHAWLTADGVEIVSKAGEYVELNCF